MLFGSQLQTAQKIKKQPVLPVKKTGGFSGGGMNVINALSLYGRDAGIRQNATNLIQRQKEAAMGGAVAKTPEQLMAEQEKLKIKKLNEPNPNWQY